SQAVEEYEAGDSDTKPAPLRGDRAVVVNVTSKTYGTDVRNDEVSNLIFANTSLPARMTDTFLTMHDNQRAVSVKVYESDFTDPAKDKVVKDKFCTLLENKTLQVTGDYPKGTQITVTFNISNEGILSVNACIGSDELDFALKIAGVKSNAELSQSKNMVAKARVE
ncbi:MAG: Hsp70 family protein, partial [Muribaculaceae bacterium]|nr:Hsp70 family protein [Muribaculaceae bacterium]